MVGVADGVKVNVGIGEGVFVSITTLGGGSVAVDAGDVEVGWQAQTKRNTNKVT